MMYPFVPFLPSFFCTSLYPVLLLFLIQMKQLMKKNVKQGRERAEVWEWWWGHTFFIGTYMSPQSGEQQKQPGYESGESSLGQCNGSCGESVPPVVFTRSWRASCAPEMCVMVEEW